jgi:hypothetical protein
MDLLDCAVVERAIHKMQSLSTAHAQHLLSLGFAYETNA